MGITWSTYIKEDRNFTGKAHMIDNNYNSLLFIHVPISIFL